LKSIGQQIATMSKMYAWLEDNIDMLFTDPRLQKKFGTKKKMENNKNIEEVMNANCIGF